MAAEPDGMGGFYSFILDDHGDVWELRNPVNADEGEFHRLKGLHDIVSLAPLGAVRRDGKVFTWNLRPDYPDGGFTIPKMVKGIDHAVAIDSGFHGFLVLLGDGTLVEWREAFQPYFPEHHSPELVAGISGVIQVSGKESGGVVLTRDGNVLLWRHNYRGELVSNHRDPKEVAHSTETQLLYGGGDAKQVLSLGFLTVVLKKDGHVLYWGSEPRPDSKVELTGYVDEIDDVDRMFRDAVGSVFYVRRDGSVWWADAPNPARPLPPCSRKYDPKDRMLMRACKIEGIAVPVISAASGGGPNLLIGGDHSLWEGNDSIVHTIELPE